MIILIAAPNPGTQSVLFNSLVNRKKHFSVNSGDYTEICFYDTPNEPVDEVFVELPTLVKSARVKQLDAVGMLLSTFSNDELPIIETVCDHRVVYAWLTICTTLLDAGSSRTEAVRTFTVQVREDEAIICSFNRFNV